MQFPHECRDVTMLASLLFFCLPGFVESPFLPAGVCGIPPFCLPGFVESPALSGTPFCKGGSLPGSGACRARSLPECCRRSVTYGYGRLRLSDAALCGYLFMISERFVSLFYKQGLKSPASILVVL